MAVSKRDFYHLLSLSLCFPVGEERGKGLIDRVRGGVGG